ncbi:hypothetical protein ASE75_00360 [Sphingomonas sp. Leaf17]|uniref:flagellar hook-length control protein FliK n=1 Tax=Sphingomonas sp. Leaf17 TaxID=1735683 RepID=UPI0007004296|nr:flagellar hook-length control protein FliK [Sphingomonas sp. Leaf17]KQM67453.1 hypothetical protein ASE75_00360 [Sphingomonas sp. Leaf17]
MIAPPTIDRANAGASPVRVDAGVGRGGPRQFAQTLAGFLDQADDAAMPATTPPPVAGRQDEASDGKPLPDETEPVTADPAFAWVTMAPSVVPLRPVAFAAPVASAAGGVLPPPAVDPAATIGAVPADPRPAGLSAIPPEATASLLAAVDLSAVPPSAGQPTSPTTPGIIRDSAGAVPDAPLPVVSREGPVPEPIVASATPAPAGQVFAAAIKAARDDDRPNATSRDPAAPLAAPGAGPTAEIRTVTATSDAQQAPLDMRRQDWPQGMIDRIEQLRDAADAADTRIRLIPDALGAIDVGVRRDGDTMHVHFTADQPATAALLADARPQLVTLAQSRGLTLGQSAVDTGAGQSHTPSQQQQAAPPRAPVSVARPSAAPATGTDDLRLA